MNNSTQHKENLELEQLRNRREQQKLTVQAVADEMKVSKDFVHYIESGDFEKLGASTFVRGHVTNYCKVIGIEPGLILQKVPKQYLQHQQLKTSDAMGGSPFSYVRRQSNYFGRYAVGTALLGVLCMSFYFIWDKWSLPSRIQPNQDMIISEGNSDDGSEKKIIYSSLIPQVTGPNYTTKPESTDDLDEGVENKDLSKEVLLDEDSGVNDEESAPESIEEVNQPNLMAEESLTDPNNLDALVYTIVMEFEEQAWVSIKTLDGDSIVQDLLGPGLREFKVTEPVRFRIGNAKKTQISINDDSIELTPMINKDIADFKWPLEPNS